MQSSSWGLPPSVPLCHTNRAAEALLSLFWWGRTSWKHVEEQWSQGCSRKQCLQATPWQDPFDGAHREYSSFVVPLLLEISSVGWGVNECQGVHAHYRFWGTFHKNIKVPANLSGWIKLLLLVLLLLMSDRHNPSVLWTTSLSCCCLLISSAYVTLEEAVTPLSLTCLSLSLENIFFSVKILTIIQVTHSPGNPGSYVDQTEGAGREGRMSNHFMSSSMCNKNIY